MFKQLSIVDYLCCGHSYNTCLYLMKILALSVDDQVADAYNSAPAEERTKMNELVNNLFNQVVRKNQLNKLFESMDRLADEAKANGLTPKKLGELMEWDHATMVNLFGEDYQHG